MARVVGWRGKNDLFWSFLPILGTNSGPSRDPERAKNGIFLGSFSTRLDNGPKIGHFLGSLDLKRVQSSVVLL